jgi:hypothetical protein
VQTVTELHQNGPRPPSDDPLQILFNRLLPFGQLGTRPHIKSDIFPEINADSVRRQKVRTLPNIVKKDVDNRARIATAELVDVDPRGGLRVVKVTRTVVSLGMLRVTILRAEVCKLDALGIVWLQTNFKRREKQLIPRGARGGSTHDGSLIW